MTPTDRPAAPSLTELRDAVQPDWVMARSAEHWTGTLYMRRLSIYLTWLLVRTPLTANGVTWLMIVAGGLAGPALLLPAPWGVVVAALLAQLQMLLDCCDGEVARWRRTMSPRGIFLDQIGHYVAEGSIGLFLGVSVALAAAPTDWRFMFAGALLMAGIWLNKSLNMMVTLARTNAGLPRLPDTPSVRAITSASMTARLRRVAGVVPLHRMFHSIELTLVSLVAALVALAAAPVWPWYVVCVTVLIWPVTMGHFIAIWKSARLVAR
ncbi:CDP-alcohol phosphatidyltransferase family protein [Tessaracoccus lacteus]|uniref:CDP-alcohol phosphatidyltransferase family protein n=1 Tax=Tessaracoccus lacteus TaxID=3041766 RepID=A0ABY8PX09_9ACTN|nr:CDP-alcohol phosphatidyltransferase family protein [Tessaracoccus sp. T21]WGT47042.1 CDP-alcohol phosphatidyltransferase family protein [Tessaracoccus sp. T21]